MLFHAGDVRFLHNIDDASYLETRFDQAFSHRFWWDSTFCVDLTAPRQFKNTALMLAVLWKKGNDHRHMQSR